MHKESQAYDLENLEPEDNKPSILYGKVGKFYRGYQSYQLQPGNNSERFLALIANYWPEIEQRADQLGVFSLASEESLERCKKIRNLFSKTDSIGLARSKADVFDPAKFYLVLLWYVAFNEANCRNVPDFNNKIGLKVDGLIKFYSQTNRWQLVVNEYVSQLFVVFTPYALAPLEKPLDFTAENVTLKAESHEASRLLTGLAIALIILSVAAIIVGALSLAVMLSATASSLVPALAPLAAVGVPGAASTLAAGVAGLVSGVGFFAYQAYTHSAIPEDSDVSLLQPQRY